MPTIARAVRFLSTVCGVLAAICLVAACLVISEMVFIRYVLEASTIWQTEFVLYSVVASTLLGSPYVLLKGGHVSVDILEVLLGPRVRRVQRLFAACLGLAFCAMLAWSGTRYFYEAWHEGWVTESVWAPRLWVLLLPLPVGIGTLVLQYLVEIAGLLGRGSPAAGPGEAADS